METWLRSLPKRMERHACQAAATAAVVLVLAAVEGMCCRQRTDSHPAVPSSLWASLWAGGDHASLLVQLEPTATCRCSIQFAGAQFN